MSERSSVRSSSIFAVLPLAAAVCCAVVVGCASSDAVTGADETTAFDTTAAHGDGGTTATDGGTTTGDGGVKTIVPSQLAASLTAAGLDIHQLPKLESLPDAQLHKVMSTFTKALGVQCNGCHDTSDYSASTPQKIIALNMWDQFVLGLKTKDGSAFYCDSCHQGQKDFLDRSSHQGLASFMSANFVGKLQRVDGQTHDCSTCHGNPFKGDIFKDIWHDGE
jgi:hypothetical protein